MELRIFPLFLWQFFPTERRYSTAKAIQITGPKRLWYRGNRSRTGFGRIDFGCFVRVYLVSFMDLYGTMVG